MTLSDAELERISELLLDKMLKQLAKVSSQEPVPASNTNGEPNKCGKVTIRPTGTERPTAADYEFAARWNRRRAHRE